MKKLCILLSLALTGCSTYPERLVNITYGYAFDLAEERCEEHAGLHFVVSVTDIKNDHVENSDLQSYPCSQRILVECLDGSFHEGDLMIDYCVSSQNDLNGALNESSLKVKD